MEWRRNQSAQFWAVYEALHPPVDIDTFAHVATEDVDYLRGQRLVFVLQDAGFEWTPSQRAFRGPCGTLLSAEMVERCSRMHATGIMSVVRELEKAAEEKSFENRLTREDR